MFRKKEQVGVAARPLPPIKIPVKYQINGFGYDGRAPGANQRFGLVYQAQLPGLDGAAIRRHQAAVPVKPVYFARLSAHAQGRVAVGRRPQEKRD
jgi:hypothetical protein